MRARGFGSKMLLGCLVLAAATVSGVAQAACRTADLAGTWYAMGVSGNIVGSYFDISNRCKIQISSTGAIIASGSSCNFYDWTGDGTSNITGGKLKVSSYCAITGYISICEPNGCGHIRIPYAQMESSKDAFPLQGFFNADPGFRYNLHFVKR